jgi:hypothetical protein
MTEERAIFRVSRQSQAIAACVKGRRPPSAVRAAEPPEMLSLACDAALRLVECAREEILRRFDDGGIAFEMGDGERIVQLWGCIEFAVAVDGCQFNARLLDALPSARRLHVRPDLSQPIGRFTWTPLFDAVLAASGKEAGIDFPRVLPETRDYIAAVMRRTFRDYLDWNGLRRQVLRYLRPDPLVHSLTRRTFEDGIPTLDSFNWVAGRERELSRIAIERPALLPFLQLVSGSASGWPLRKFEEALHRAGIKSSARRKLERWGFAPFSAATFFGTAPHPVTLVAHYANLLDRLGIADAPPAMFTELVVRGLDFQAPDWYLQALLKEILALDEDDPYPPEFEETKAWLETRPSAPDRSQQRAGWRWIVTQSRRHRIACDTTANIPWATSGGEYVEGDYRVVPIRTLRELLEEAEAMRNCLGTMAEDCASGRIVLYSVRERRGDKRHACFSITWVPQPGFWQLLQIAGKRNAEASPALTDLALRVIATLAKPERYPGS